MDVDGRHVDIPSYALEPGQEVRIHPGSRVEPLARQALELTAEVPPWLQLDPEGLSGRATALPERDQVQVPFDERRIIEFYSR